MGTVVALEHDGRTATFRVEEVWKGTLGETVVVHGGPGIPAIESAATRGEGVASSVDRRYTMGTRYLVLPYGKSGGVLRDGICSNTQRYVLAKQELRVVTDDLPGMELSGPRRPHADGGGSDWLTWPVLVLLAALCTGLTAGLAWFGLRTRRAA